MKVQKSNLEIEVPEGIQAIVNGFELSLKGKNGEVKREFPSKKISIQIDKNKLIMAANKATKNEKKMMGTFRSHIRNMIKGVEQKHRYQVKICSGHFPMNITINKNTFIVKNFIGEKIPRSYIIKQGAEVKIDGDIINVEGIDKEIVADVAASIERLTRITNKDRRIFQDGLYMVMKDGRELK